MVEADTEARRINLWVQGERRKEYLHFLWFMLREINSSYKEMLFKEEIPLADSPPVMADYQTLLRYAARPDDTYYADGSEKEYHARELLGMVMPDKEDALLMTMQKLPGAA